MKKKKIENEADYKIRIIPKKKNPRINLKQFVKEKILRAPYYNVGYDDIIIPLVLVVLFIIVILGIGALIWTIAQQVSWPSVIIFFSWAFVIIGSIITGIRLLHWWLNS